MDKPERVLVVGGGGREHAICWKLRADNPQIELHAAPGNPGIADGLAVCHQVAATDLDGIVALAGGIAASLVVIGPEAPLAAGLADRLRDDRVLVFGPSSAAARIESSKHFAKRLMLDNGIPTARATHHTEPEPAMRAARELGAPVVIKASGLAGGKGVYVCGTIEESDAAISAILKSGMGGGSEAGLLVEEFMEGEELSVFAITDGDSFVLLEPSQDHKRLLEGDRGPNTGGMGAYAPVSLATPALLSEIGSTIVAPALAAMRDYGGAFSGLLYTGLMVTLDGPKVVEFNCRFGDPETQVVLPLLAEDLLELLLAAARPGGMEGSAEVARAQRKAITIVVAADGYPERPKTGSPILIDEQRIPSGAIVFHAGTTRLTDGTLATAGGRVLSVTGIGDTLDEAAAVSKGGIAAVSFEGMHWRGDIGWRELARERLPHPHPGLF